MNWREHPNLFANGKFKCEAHSYFYDIIGYSCNHGVPIDIDTVEYKKCFFLDNGPYYNGFNSLEDCTLVARKIEDLSDEEEKDCLRLMEGYCGEYGNDDIALFIYQTSEGMLYALSIGVYPGKFPDDNSVITMEESK